MPDADIVQLTPEQQALYDKQAGGSDTGVINPLRDFDAHQLADLAVKDKDNFDLVETFRQNQDLWKDPSTVQKVAEAHNLIKQRGFNLSDLPGPKKIAGMAFDVGKGFVKQAWNYAQGLIGTPIASFVGDVTGQKDGFQTELGNLGQRQVAENLAGSEQAVTGLAHMGEKAIHKAGQKLGIAKDYKTFTPEEKVKDLWDAVGKGEVQQDISTGHGAAMTAVGGEVIKDLEAEGTPIRPEEVQALSAGDPFTFYAFGKAFQGAGKLVPQGVKNVAGTVAEKAGEGLTKAAGTTIEKTANLTEAGANATKVAAKYTLPVAGAATGAMKAGPLGVLPGIAGGQVASRTVGKVADVVAKNAKGVSEFGKQVAGKVPVTSAAAQATKDVLEAAPGAAGSVAEGAALDLGTAAVSSESPKDTEGTGIGAAFGVAGAARKVIPHVISGQIIAPRAYGSRSAVSSSGNFPIFDKMHADALQAAAPGVRERLNAIREFAKGAAPDVDVFLAKDPATLKSALEQTGVSPEQAESMSQQNGFFTLNMPDKAGNPRRVIIAQNVESAPHESFHAVQDVLGESANRTLDKEIQSAYGDKWEALGNDYATRYAGGDIQGQNWRDVILDGSGWGRAEAVEKLSREISNQLRNETGAEPDPNFVKQRVAGEWNSRLATAEKNNPGLSKEQLDGQIWRDILTPEEAKEVGDRYLAREIAAENFDAIFKNQGPSLEAGTSIPQRLAGVVGKLADYFGANVLSGRKSAEGTPLDFGIAEKVRGAAKSAQASVEPKKPSAPPKVSVEPTAPKPEAPAPAPATPEPPKEAITKENTEADNARKIADEAPDKPTSNLPEAKSPRENLGAVAEAIAQGTGVKINYHSAPDEPAAATSSNREARRAIIESFRTMPKEARALWEKTFFPDKVIKSKNGVQIQGWAPEVFASNAHKMADVLADVDPALSPYPIDPEFKTFTAEGWKELYKDVQTFVKNQTGGRTGAGEPLVVPKSVTEKGAFAPPIKGKAEALDQTKADFINMLFNFRLPDTPRVQTGRLPLNIIGQEVSEATKPGRVEVPVRPRGEFTGKEADKLGIAGRSVMEVNPVRQAIERAALAKGKAMPEMIEAIQKLNLENINDVQLAPEAPEFRGNTLTLTSGFQPASKSVKESGKEYIDSAAIRLNGKVYTGKWHGDAMENAMKDGQFELDLSEGGFTTNTGRFVNREEAYKIATESGQMKPEDFARRGGKESKKLESTIFSETRQFQPKAVEDLRNDSEWEKIKNWPSGKFGGGLTGWAFERGAEVKSAEELSALRAANEEFSALSKAALANKDFDKAMSYMSRAQAAHEAYQAATGEKIDGTPTAVNFIRSHFDKDYTPPMPGESYKKSLSEGVDKPANMGDNKPMIQAQPKNFASPEFDRELDKIKSGENFGQTFTSAGKVWTPSGKSDIVTLASRNIPVEDLSRESVDKALEPYAALLKHPNVVAGVFAFEKDGKNYVSVDLNATVPQEHRDNSVAFAKANNQISIWDATKGETVETGGNGETTLTDPADIAKALPDLVAGKSVKFPTKPEDWQLPAKSASGYKKAWITPEGQPVQLGGQFHHEYLAEHPEYGIKVTESPSVAEDSRVDALKKGFARINYAVNSGTLNVEARAADWPKQRDAVRQFVESNLGDIDNFRLVLMDPAVKSVNSDNTTKLFEYDDADKLSHLPILSESAPVARKELGPRSQRELEIERFQKEQEKAAAKGELALGDEPTEQKRALTPAEVSGLSRKELSAHFPEAIIPKDREESIPSDIVNAPLAKKAGSPEKAVEAFSKKLVEFAKQWEGHPAYLAGKKWYEEFTPMLKKEFGKEAPIFAELLAATSPLNSPEVNFRYALDAVEGIRSGRFKKQIEKFEQGLSMLENERWLAWYNRELKAGNIPNPPKSPTEAAFLEAWIDKHDLKPRQSNGKLYGQHSIPVLQVLARRWLDSARGPKTKNFVGNLIGDTHEATIDLWADRTLRRIGYEGFVDRWRILPQNKRGVSDADFAFAQKVFRHAADELKISPSALQGALWFAEKQLWADNGWARLDLGDFRKEMEKMVAARNEPKQLPLIEVKQRALR